MKPMYLNLSEVCEFLTLGKFTVQKLVRKNEFPRPRLLSQNRVAWLVKEVEEWGDSRPHSDLLPPPNTGNRRKVPASQPAL